MSTHHLLEEALQGAHGAHDEITALCRFAPGSSMDEARARKPALSLASLASGIPGGDLYGGQGWRIASAAKKLAAGGHAWPRGSKTLAKKALAGDQAATDKLEKPLSNNKFIASIRGATPVQGKQDYPATLVGVGDIVTWLDKNSGFGTSTPTAYGAVKVVSIDPKKRKVGIEDKYGKTFVSYREIKHRSQVGNRPGGRSY